MDIKKKTERSVDSLQRVYAFAIALALGESIRRLVLDTKTGATRFHWDYLPPFLALMLTLVPFYHGMNRHLDEAYVAPSSKTPPSGALLFDFCFFFMEAAALFVLATLVDNPQTFFRFLAVFLLVDSLWGLVTYWISDGMGKQWAVLNFSAAMLTLLFCFQIILPSSVNPWGALVVAFARTIADYLWCWEYYFPTRADAGR